MYELYKNNDIYKANKEHVHDRYVRPTFFPSRRMTIGSTFIDK